MTAATTTEPLSAALCRSGAAVIAAVQQLFLAWSGISKICVLIRQMVRNEVEDHSQTSSMRRRNKIAQLSLTAEIWSNLEVIGDGVAEILGRSTSDRREPERRNAQ